MTGSGSCWSRFTANTVSSSPESTATASAFGTAPKADVWYTGAATSGAQHVPRPCRAVSANGWKMVCRQAGPPGSVRIGPITFTSWARHAMRDPVGVPEQGDQQAADHHRVGQGVASSISRGASFQVALGLGRACARRSTRRRTG